MSGITKESQYGASRSSYSSADKRYTPYNKSNAARNNRTNGCFNCGEDGHFSRECPQKRGASSNSSFQGFKQNKFGMGTNDFNIKFGQAGGGLVAVDWAERSLLPFKKDFYEESANTASLSLETIDEWKKQHDIECFYGYQESIKKNNFYASAPSSKSEAKKVPNPIMGFKDCAAFPPIVQRSIAKSGFEAPTPIQSATWPILLSGYNVIGVARTGSGKTLAFLLPAVVHIFAQPKIRYGDGPIAVIVAPTRELACQIEGEVVKFACNVRHCCVYGGAPRWGQKRKLLAGVSIVIATPGRLLDFLESKVTNFKRVTYCVIDEADRLLDMGFEPQLNAIMSQIRPDRQMMMFSATWPKEVRSLAKNYMVNNDDSNIYQVAIGSMDTLKANKDVLQEILFMEKGEKISELKRLIDVYIEEDKECKILVFIATKRMCNQISEMLWSDGYWVTCIHGDKAQNQRDRALASFREGKMKIMLATDVASRGIHVDDIKLVINFDFPNQIEDYVHRIGRTGRAGSKGTAISFFVGAEDGGKAKQLVQVLKDANQKVPAELLQFRSMDRGRGRRNFNRNRFYRNRNSRW